MVLVQFFEMFRVYNICFIYFPYIKWLCIRVSAKAIIYNEKKEFLLIQDHNWIRDFPWWGIEFTETPQEAIKRECLEELWVADVEVKSKIITFFTYYMEDVKLWIWMAYYEVKLPECSEIKVWDHECLAYKYASIEDSINLNLHNNVKWFIKNMT